MKWKISIIILMMVLGLSLNVSVAQTQDGLIAEYHFDEGSGATVNDTSGNDNDGIIHGANWTTGISGSALSFDGLDDHVTCGTTLTGGVLSEITVEAWINLSNVEEDNWIFYDGSDGEFWLGARTNQTLFFQMKDFQAVFHPIYTDSILVANQWYYVAGVYNGSSTKIYVNGQLEGTSTFSNASPFNPGGAYYPTIGSYSGPSNQLGACLNGTIDEIKVYSRALSAEEILENYQEYAPNGNGGETPGFELGTLLIATTLAFIVTTVIRRKKQ